MEIEPGLAALQSPPLVVRVLLAEIVAVLTPIDATVRLTATVPVYRQVPTIVLRLNAALATVAVIAVRPVGSVPEKETYLRSMPARTVPAEAMPEQPVIELEPVEVARTVPMTAPLVLAIRLLSWIPSLTAQVVLPAGALNVGLPLNVTSSPGVPMAVLAEAVPTANASATVARTAEKTTDVRLMR